MDSRAFQTELRRLASEMQTLAAAGALLRLRQDEARSNPASAEALESFVQATLPDTIGKLDEQQATLALAFIDLFVEEAAELLRDPGRAPGWNVDNPVLLQAQGRLSRQGFRAIQALSVIFPDMAQAFDGRFLDVGTGVGGIVLEAVERCPSLRAVGIDIWEPGLALARANAAASPHADRIEIRKLDVKALDEINAFDVIWMPPLFMDRETVEIALDRFSQALKPRGFVVLGHHALPPNPAAAAFSKLRTARTGGYIWDRADIEEQLSKRGFSDVQTASPTPEANFVIGRRP